MNADDMQLLKLAAKAVGYEIIGCHEKLGLRVWNADRSHGFKWNPLHDDGDALGLLVWIKIYYPHHAHVITDLPHNGFDIGRNCSDLRRAIVKLAVEISQEVA